MKVYRLKNNQIIAHKLKVANSFYSRLKGLMFVDEMKEMDALLLNPCNSIHNFFVKFPLDVVFLTDDYKVVKIIKNFRPWQVSGIYFSAKQTLELKAGALPSDLAVGEYLEVRNV